MIRILLPTLFLLFGYNAIGQNAVQPKYVYVKFDTYSVKEDKLIQQQLSNEKVVYTCIPSGIIVIEVAATDASAESRISGEMKAVTGIPTFSFAHDMTLSDAENSCTTLRKPE